MPEFLFPPLPCLVWAQAAPGVWLMPGLAHHDPESPRLGHPSILDTAGVTVASFVSLIVPPDAQVCSQVLCWDSLSGCPWMRVTLSRLRKVYSRPRSVGASPSWLRGDREALMEPEMFAAENKL